MRIRKLLLMVVAAAATMISCQPDSPEAPAVESITALVESVSFEAVNAEPMTVEVEVKNLKATLNAIAADEWCHVAVVEGTRFSPVEPTLVQLAISVDNNIAEESRQTTIYLSGETASDEIEVSQLGISPALEVSATELETSAEGGNLALNVTTNIDFEVVSKAEWITYEVVEDSIALIVEKNITTEAREGEVVVRNVEFGIFNTVTVKQEAGKEPERVRDTDDYFVPYTSLTYKGEVRPGCTIENVYDNKLESYWSCPNAGIKGNAVLTFTFDGKYRVDYMDYYPSPDYGQWGKFTVKYKSKGDRQYTDLGEFDFGMKDGKQTLKFENAITNVTEIIIEVISAKGRDNITKGLLAGASEIEFFYSSDVFYSPIELFEDESCSVFRNPNFSAEDLDKIQNEDLRHVAEVMLNRKAEDNEFRVATYKTYPHPDLDAAKYHTSTYTKLDNVTGMLLLPGNTYTICVSEDGHEEISVKLVVNNYKYLYRNPTGNQNRIHFNSASRSYALRTGINKIEIKDDPERLEGYGGLAYIEYFSVKDSEVKINFIDGEVNGYYDTEIHTPDQWLGLVEKSLDIEARTGFAANFDMRSPKVVMTMPSDMLLNRTQTGERAEKLMAIHDSIVMLEEQLQGHYLYNTGGHANRMRMVGRHGGSYMYAGSYETGYDISGGDCQRTVMDPDYTKRDSWGIAHEMGHVNQVRNSLKWVGTSEVTNNICSAYVNWVFLGETRLRQNTVHVGYEGAFSDIMARDCSHVFVGSWDEAYYLKVVPFWQLYLYFTEVKGMTDFYPTIYHTCRNYVDCADMSNEEAMCRFMELVSDITKTDMTEFFERWGFLKPLENMWFNDYGAVEVNISEARINQAIEHMSKYEKPTQPIWFITENNLHLFKEKPQVKVGTAAVNQAQDTYRFSDWENCVAYVVRGTDGREWGIGDACDPDEKLRLHVTTSWNEFKWGDRNGNLSPGNVNSKTYYCTVGKSSVTKTPKNTPALKGAECFGVGADGVYYPAKK